MTMKTRRRRKKKKKKKEKKKKKQKQKNVEEEKLAYRLANHHCILGRLDARYYSEI
jgi:hypothetical protein